MIYIKNFIFDLIFIIINIKFEKIIINKIFNNNFKL